MLRVNPIENITMLKRGTIKSFKLNHGSGSKKAHIENTIAQTGNKTVNVLITLII